MQVGSDSSFIQSTPGVGLGQKAMTLKGQDATAVNYSNSSDIDTKSIDTVNLSSNVSGVTGGTAATQLTASLAELLQGATAVDSATGIREINAGAGQALSSQLGQLLTQSGFSQADADAATKSLVTQLSSTSQASKGIAISLTGSASNSGSYVGAVSGGVEDSSWTAQSTTALSIALDASGNLTVNLDDHQVGATSVGWGSATPGNVSIAFTQAELQVTNFIGDGTTKVPTGSAIQESQTTTSEAAPVGYIGGSNATYPAQGAGTGSQALANLDGLVSWADETNFTNPASALAGSNLNGAGSASTPTLDGASAVATPKTAKETAAQQAENTLQAVLKQLHDAAKAASVSFQATTNTGTLVSNGDGTKSLTYTRPSGDKGVVNLANVNVNA